LDLLERKKGAVTRQCLIYVASAYVIFTSRVRPGFEKPVPTVRVMQCFAV
jgi:hypothetical protein